MSTEEIKIAITLYVIFSGFRGLYLWAVDENINTLALNLSRGFFWPIDAIKVFVRAFWRTVSKW